MKKNIALTLVGVVALCAELKAQQLRPTIVTNTVYLPVTWKGDAASCVTSQLLSMTNIDGSKVIPTNAMSGRTTDIFIHIQTGTNGLKTITASVH